MGKLLSREAALKIILLIREGEVVAIQAAQDMALQTPMVLQTLMVPTLTAPTPTATTTTTTTR